MPKKHTYRFCFGPWNISEGQDPYGPPVRPVASFDWKLAQLKKLGFDAMMFHDDDAVPDIDSKSETQIRKEAKALRKRLDGEGIAAEMVAPRLWFAPQTIDGAYTSNNPKDRQYAIDRSLRSIDIANILGTDILVLWLAREGSYIRESKNARGCWRTGKFRSGRDNRFGVGFAVFREVQLPEEKSSLRKRFYFDRAIGRHRHHRHSGGAAVAGIVACEVLGKEYCMQKQSETDHPWNSLIHEHAWGVSALRLHELESGPWRLGKAS